MEISFLNKKEKDSNDENLLRKVSLLLRLDQIIMGTEVFECQRIFYVYQRDPKRCRPRLHQHQKILNKSHENCKPINKKHN